MPPFLLDARNKFTIHLNKDLAAEEEDNRDDDEEELIGGSLNGIQIEFHSADEWNRQNTRYTPLLFSLCPLVSVFLSLSLSLHFLISLRSSLFIEFFSIQFEQFE